VWLEVAAVGQERLLVPAAPGRALMPFRITRDSFAQGCSMPCSSYRQQAGSKRQAGGQRPGRSDGSIQQRQRLLPAARLLRDKQQPLHREERNASSAGGGLDSPLAFLPASPCRNLLLLSKGYCRCCRCSLTGCPSHSPREACRRGAGRAGRGERAPRRSGRRAAPPFSTITPHIQLSSAAGGRRVQQIAPLPVAG
jgi:hypothetical protein